MKIALSSCLAGNKVRYDGTDKKNEELLKLLKGHELICICPEAMIFSIPHEALEIRDDKAFTISGKDVSKELKEACQNCFEKIKDSDLVILKSKSPSCGYGKIYDGSFSGKLKDGHGFLAALCVQHNMMIFTENELDKIREYISQ